MTSDRHHMLSDDPICRKCGEALEPNGCRCLRNAGSSTPAPPDDCEMLSVEEHQPRLATTKEQSDPGSSGEQTQQIAAHEGYGG